MLIDNINDVVSCTTYNCLSEATYLVSEAFMKGALDRLNLHLLAVVRVQTSPFFFRDDSILFKSGHIDGLDAIGEIWRYLVKLITPDC